MVGNNMDTRSDCSLCVHANRSLQHPICLECTSSNNTWGDAKNRFEYAATNALLDIMDEKSWLKTKTQRINQLQKLRRITKA
jgi:hypothetical protein